MEEFLRNYGYTALSAGTFLEGEVAILIAASLIYKGLFTLPLTIFFGFIGSFVSDWMYFMAGRLNIRWILNRIPSAEKVVTPMKAFFLKNQIPILLSYRFMYGFRIVLPIAMGISGVPIFRFFIFSVISGASWASLVAILGYALGFWFTITPQFIESNFIIIILFFLGLGTVIGLLFRQMMSKNMAIDPNVNRENAP